MGVRISYVPILYGVSRVYFNIHVPLDCGIVPDGQFVGNCAAGFAETASSCLKTNEFVAGDWRSNVVADVAEDGLADAAVACLALSSALKRA